MTHSWSGAGAALRVPLFPSQLGMVVAERGCNYTAMSHLPPQSTSGARWTFDLTQDSTDVLRQGECRTLSWKSENIYCNKAINDLLQSLISALVRIPLPPCNKGRNGCSWSLRRLVSSLVRAPVGGTLSSHSSCPVLRYNTSECQSKIKRDFFSPALLLICATDRSRQPLS